VSTLRGKLPDEAVDLIESGQIRRPTHYHGPRLDDGTVIPSEPTLTIHRELVKRLPTKRRRWREGP
jgi:hypothetical protein